MSTVFQMPEIGEGVVEAELVEWRVAAGDHVDKDQPLCEVMTDKASVEIPSPRAGVVVDLHAEPGDFVPVHAPLLELAEAPGEAPAAAQPPPEAAPTSAPRVRATPAVRRRAREQGVPIAAVTGTGPGGRVSHQDLDRHLGAPPPAAPVAPEPPTAPPVDPAIDPGDERVRIIGLRRRIAEQMVRAKRTAPHFTYVEELDATRLVEVRQQLLPRADGSRLSYLAFVAKACSVAFRDFPQVNAWVDEDRFELVVKHSHHIGIATATPRGLYVPVVRDVQSMSILEIAMAIEDVVARARAGTAARDELVGSTFTLTGVGHIGGVLATPILNPPEVAIFGFNAIRDAAVVRDGQVVIRKMAYLSPSFDHRIVDGAVGAAFTARVKELLEQPESLLLELS